MKYLVVIEKGPESYGGYLPDLPGCVAVGDTPDEVFALLKAAVPDHIQVLRENGEEVPKPTTASVELEVRVPA